MIKINDESSIWYSVARVALWVFVALIVNVIIFFTMGQELALQFTAGYLIELSLSIDNLFVFITIFLGFGLWEHAQHRVLGWGIIGAIVLRFVFIFFGIKLVEMFEWILYVFGAVLVFQGIRMYVEKEEEATDPHEKLAVRLMAKVFPMSESFDGDRFLTRNDAGKRMMTPLFAVLVLIETSDIIFAIDSVPAVFSVSTNLIVVYVSNILAILGLRQLYFVLEHLQERFAYVKYGVATLLLFTGVKMLLGIFDIHIATGIAIIIILSVLVLSILISVLVSKKEGSSNV